MRQYEKNDCPEDSFVGQELEVCRSVSSVWNEADLVVGFGNPKTRKLVWVPYGSKVSIDCQGYDIIRGELYKTGGLRVWTRDQSVVCLRNRDGILESIDTHFKKPAKVIYLEDSFLSNLSNAFFDWRYLKSEKSQNGWRMLRALRN